MGRSSSGECGRGDWSGDDGRYEGLLFWMGCSWRRRRAELLMEAVSGLDFLTNWSIDRACDDHRKTETKLSKEGRSIGKSQAKKAENRRCWSIEYSEKIIRKISGSDGTMSTSHTQRTRRKKVSTTMLPTPSWPLSPFDPSNPRRGSTWKRLSQDQIAVSDPQEAALGIARYDPQPWNALRTEVARRGWEGEGDTPLSSA